LAQAAIVVVPALSVDRRGNRLGRGRGYYDRALSDLAGSVVAVVYDDELIDEVPAEPHDRRVDAVLQPRGLTSSS
jgi:5-formyltetrahydrofolate cyclo-ligase